MSDRASSALIGRYNRSGSPPTGSKPNHNGERASPAIAIANAIDVASSERPNVRFRVSMFGRSSLIDQVIVIRVPKKDVRIVVSYLETYINAYDIRFRSRRRIEADDRSGSLKQLEDRLDSAIDDGDRLISRALEFAIERDSNRMEDRRHDFRGFDRAILGGMAD